MVNCRRRLELVLGKRINWLQTCGLQEVQPTNWEQAESGIRQALINCIGLSYDECRQFIQVAKEYIKSFEDMVNEADAENDPNVLLPLSYYQAKYKI